MNAGILAPGYAPPMLPRPLLGQPQPVPTPYGRAGDPYWDNVSLLLRMDGPNGSSIFVDESRNPATVAAVGGAQMTAVRSRFTTTSGVFGGSGVRLGLGTGDSRYFFRALDFTIEAWVFRTSSATGCVVCGQSNLSSAAGSAWVFLLGSTAFCDVYVGSGGFSVASPNPPLNVWSHVAFVRNGRNLFTFLNGSVVGMRSDLGTSTLNDGATTHQATVGAFNNNNNRFVGNISELRITRGIARYLPNFPPPIAPFPTGAARTIRATADPHWNNVSLLIRGNGENNATTITDSSSNALTVTANGDAKISTAQSKFEGSSVVFDGTGDFLSMTSAALPLGTGDFTIEGWLYRLGNTGESALRLQTLVTSRPSDSASTACYDFFVDRNDTAAPPRLAFGRPGLWIAFGGSVTNNTWHHVAVVRSSGTATVYLNGQSVGSGSASTINDTQQSVWIAGKAGTSLGQFHGHLSDWRITKGIARYNANFDPPTSQFPGY